MSAFSKTCLNNTYHLYSTTAHVTASFMVEEAYGILHWITGCRPINEDQQHAA